MKIAFFSDLHAGSPFINLKYIENLTQAINTEKPDIVLIGGDWVTNEVMGGHPIAFTDVAKKLSKIQSKFGTFTVLGNHDWWSDETDIRETLINSGIHVLENESMIISIENQPTFNLIAVGDDMTGHANVVNAFSKIKNNLPKIVLLHDPGALLDLNPKETFNLAFAGHLHGGQVNLPFLGPLITPGRAPKEWSTGWTDTIWGKLFVTNGIGTSILPIRFNAPPEVVIIKFDHF
jgi:predicted MPP superfamily phosphohydrolase